MSPPHIKTVDNYMFEKRIKKQTTIIKIS